jgi:hypothetical protein
MTTRCISGNNVLSDEKGEKFRVENKGDYSTVYNSRKMGLFNDVKKLMGKGIKRFFFDFGNKESSEEVDKIMGIYDKIIKGQQVNTNKIRRGYTTGHIFRGVQ